MSAKQEDVGSSPVHDQNFFVQVFFGLVGLFFAIFLNVSIGSPLHFFPTLQKNGYSKTPKGPLLPFSALCDLLETKKIRKRYFEKKIQQNSDFQFFPHAGNVEENT